MTRHRSFSFTTEEQESVTFDVNGEQFVCVSSIPAGVLLDTATELVGSGTMNPAAIGEFFDAVIVEDDRERFAKLLRAEGGPGLDTLVEITKYLVEEYTGFPTQMPNGLYPQLPTTGRGSVGSSSSKGSNSKGSRQGRR